MVVTRDIVVKQLTEYIGAGPESLMPTGEMGWYIRLAYEGVQGVRYNYGTLTIVARMDDIVFRFSHTGDDADYTRDEIREYDITSIYKYSTIGRLDKGVFHESDEDAILQGYDITYIKVVANNGEVVGTWPIIFDVV